MTGHRIQYLHLSCAIIIALMVFDGCSKSGTTIDVETHKKEIEEWQTKRLTRLTRDDGWLTLCGLFWLKEGENKFGTDSSNAIIFPPGKAPAFCGSLWLDHGTIRIQAKPGVQTRLKDSLVATVTMKSDEEAGVDPTIISIGTLMFHVIKRGDQFGVRVKDKENPARTNFKGLEFFPIDTKWRFEAKFVPYLPPKTLKIATMINTVEDDSCPGALAFTHDGKDYRIDVVVEKGSEDQFFIMFSDATSGKETYGVGRQVYTNLPDKENNVVLDFNKAYNWPCVFTEFATCPIPPRQNQLSFRVEAGEKMYRGH